MHSSGVILENHYSYELCTPTRGALLTGRYSMRLGLWNENLGELPLSETTLAQELQSAGYKTYMVRAMHYLLSNRPHIFVLMGVVLTVIYNFCTLSYLSAQISKSHSHYFLVMHRSVNGI